jgi:hypothetical protein
MISSYYHIIILSYHHIIRYHIIILSYYHIIILSYYHIIILSYYHIIILSYYHIIILSHYHIVMTISSYSHDITKNCIICDRFSLFFYRENGITDSYLTLSSFSTTGTAYSIKYLKKAHHITVNGDLEINPYTKV